MFLGSAPFFIVSDIRKSADFYSNVLGFNCPKIRDSNPPFAMPKRENMVVMLEQANNSSVRNNLGKWDAYYWVTNIQALFEEFKKNGATFLYEIEEKHYYGNLEFAVKDPDDYILAFAQEMTDNAMFSKAKTTEFKHLSPVLASENVTRDVKWYEEKLGFKNVYDSTCYQEGPMDYAVVGRQKLFLHLQFQYPDCMISTDVKFEVSNIEPLYAEFLANGVITEKSINRKTAWHTSECCFFDLSRNRITFFKDI